jgi:hypothetical protein
MANAKVTELTAATTLADTDILPCVDNVVTTPSTKKITFANFKTALAIPAAVAIGSPVEKTSGTVYQAATDGFAVGTAQKTSGTGQIAVETDAANPPTALYRANQTSGFAASICVPIKKNDYYKIVNSGDALATQFFIPLS